MLGYGRATSPAASGRCGRSTWTTRARVRFAVELVRVETFSVARRSEVRVAAAARRSCCPVRSSVPFLHLAESVVAAGGFYRCDREGHFHAVSVPADRPTRGVARISSRSLAGWRVVSRWHGEELEVINFVATNDGDGFDGYVVVVPISRPGRPARRASEATRSPPRGRASVRCGNERTVRSRPARASLRRFLALGSFR